MLELHATDHPRHTKTAKRGRPIRDGEAGIVAGYQRPRNDQEKSREGYEDRVTVEPAVIGGLIHLRLPFACGARACLAAESRPPWGVRRTDFRSHRSDRIFLIPGGRAEPAVQFAVVHSIAVGHVVEPLSPAPRQEQEPRRDEEPRGQPGEET